MFAFVCVFRIGPFTHSRMGCSKAQEALDLQSSRFSTVCLCSRLVCLLSVPFEFAACFSHSLLLLIPGSCFSRLPERWRKGIIRRGESNIRQVGFGPDGTVRHSCSQPDGSFAGMAWWLCEAPETRRINFIESSLLPQGELK